MRSAILATLALASTQASAQVYTFEPSCGEVEVEVQSASFEMKIKWQIGKAGGQDAIRIRMEREEPAADEYWAIGIGEGMADLDIMMAYPGSMCKKVDSRDCFWDMKSSKQGPPEIDTVQNFQGISVGRLTRMDGSRQGSMTFWRYLDTGDADDKVISTSGVTSMVFASGKGMPSEWTTDAQGYSSGYHGTNKGRWSGNFGSCPPLSGASGTTSAGSLLAPAVYTVSAARIHAFVATAVGAAVGAAALLA